ncbi:hypothetical protein GCM10010274_44030 [Streptomyces lavendofoliae]|uniref:Uncharacterized protein n=1 Tax=Streptomyces lavendofoliae TaxID=67314 RepID=A0A918M6F3_9ACTN|nr:hypothetical protein GCM10010274_44030 [Streptomyces lavendofoliae]
MSGTHADLVRRVRHELLRSGFSLADATDAATPGMRVVQVPAGAMVRWTPLGGSAELSGPPDHLGESTRSAVSTAVRAVLTGCGYTVMATSGTFDLIVLPPAHMEP